MERQHVLIYPCYISRVQNDLILKELHFNLKLVLCSQTHISVIRTYPSKNKQNLQNLRVMHTNGAFANGDSK